MADNKDDLTDKAFCDPNWFSWNGGYLHSNNVLFYFAASPFFDQVSGNQSLFTQWVNTPNQNDILGTRAKFENNLRNQRGIQYVVEYEPLESHAMADGPNGPEPSNVWVIRKQNRENERDDGVTVLGYYYIVNNIIFQAPSVASVLSNRLLNTVSALNNLFSLPSDLSFFSVSHGHTYHKPVQPSTRQALAGTGQQSREGSVIPETQVSAPDKTTATTQAQDDMDSGIRTAYAALNMTMQYGKEYVDDVPLAGEPGNFRLSKNKDTTAAAGQTRGPGQASSTSPAATPGASRAASVVAPITSVPAMGLKGTKAGEKAAEVAPKAKRRKSKVGSPSP